MGDVENKGEVVSLRMAKAIKENDNTLVTPLELLDDAKREILSGVRACDKLLVITLDTKNGGYDIGFYMANLKDSESIALLEVIKHLFIKDMGY